MAKDAKEYGFDLSVSTVSGVVSGIIVGKLTSQNSTSEEHTAYFSEPELQSNGAVTFMPIVIGFSIAIIVLLFRLKQSRY